MLGPLPAPPAAPLRAPLRDSSPVLSAGCGGSPGHRVAAALSHGLLRQPVPGAVDGEPRQHTAPAPRAAGTGGQRGAHRVPAPSLGPARAPGRAELPAPLGARCRVPKAPPRGVVAIEQQRGHCQPGPGDGHAGPPRPCRGERLPSPAAPRERCGGFPPKFPTRCCGLSTDWLIAAPAGAGTSLTFPLPAGEAARAPRPAGEWRAAKHRGPRSLLSVAAAAALWDRVGRGGGIADASCQG